MAIASRLTNTGTLLVNNSFDEVSYSANGTTGAYSYNNGVSTSLNLLAYSQDFTQWSKNVAPNDYTVSADSTTAPDGSTTADLIIKSTGVGSSSICYKLFTGAISTAYCGSIYVKAGGYSKVQVVLGNSAFNNIDTGGTFDLAGAGTVNSILNGSTCTITFVGNSWYRITVTATSDADGGNYVFAVTPLNASYATNFAGDGTSGVYLWGAQVEAGSTATAYVATGSTTSINLNNFAQRVNSSGIEYASGSFDEVSYSASGGTGQLGINGINTGNNIVSYSQQFNQTSKWGTGNVTVAINVTPAPENSLTGTKLTEDSVASTRHVITQNIPVTAGALSNTYSASVFAKAGERGNIAIGLKEYTGFTNQATAFFNLSTGTVGSLTAANGASVPTGNITPVGNNWYQCAMSTNLGNATATAIGMEISVANSSSNNTYTGDGTSGLYIWGAQTQQAAAATVYVATGPTANVNLNNFARRDVTTGVEFVYDNFDEVTWNPPIVTSGLVLNLDAAVPGSYLGTGTTWTDLSGSSNNGTLVNAPTFSNLNYGQFQFDYTLSQWCSFASAGSLQFLNLSPYTLEAWIYPTVDAGAANYTGIFNRESSAMGTRDGYNFIIVQTGGTGQLLFVERFVGGVSITVGETISTASFLNTWNHVVATFDGSVLKLYRNGVLKQTSASTTANLTNNVQTLEVARRGVQYFRGNMPVARIYNTALSLTDIKQNYNALCYRYGLATI